MTWRHACGDPAPGLLDASQPTPAGARPTRSSRCSAPFCIEEGFDLTPQLQVAESGLFALVDLGSEELRLAAEADGFEHHGTRKGLRRDCRRHTELAVFGWSSLRFAFEDVIYEPLWVRWALRSWREVRQGRVPADPPMSSRQRAFAS